MFQILPETSETRADRIFDRGRGRKTGWFLVFDHPLKAIRILAKASDETCSRSKPVVEVQIRGLAATSGVCAVFLGNEDKVFVIYVEQSVGLAIALFKQGTKKGATAHP
jgi:hypothetical protein